MAFCASCGNQLARGARFCPKCGAPVDSTREDAAPDGAELAVSVPKAESSQASEDELFEKALDMIGAVSKIQFIKVDRSDFLTKQFTNSPYLEQILADGPQVVYSADALRKEADKVIMENTTKSAATSFVSGLPSNPVVMVAAGGADVVQYFGFAMNLAQKLAYLFGEDALFIDGTSEMPLEAKYRVVAYLGAMFGAGGAAKLISTTSVKVGEQVGKRVAAKALTKTAWYPLLKKVGSLVGQKITKKTVEKTITKAVPVIGGVVSGALTFVTFKPMGERLADVFTQNLKGEFATDGVLELNPEFVATLGAESGRALTE